MPSPLPDPVDLGPMSTACSSPSCATTATCCWPRRCSPRSTRAAPARRRSTRWSTRETAPMLAGHPAIAADPHDRPRLEAAGPRRAGARRVALLSALRARHYDLLVHLTEHPRGAWLSPPAAAALRASTRERDARALAVAPQLHAFLPAAATDAAPHRRSQSRRAAPHRHASPTPGDKALVLVPGRRRDGARATALLAQHGLAPQAFHPAASRFALAVQVLARRALRGACSTGSLADGWRIVLTGAPDPRERALVDAILAATCDAGRARASSTCRAIDACPSSRR